MNLTTVPTARSGPALPATPRLGAVHLTVSDLADVAAVRARAQAAGIAVEPGDHGFAVADPWDIALRLEVAP